VEKVLCAAVLLHMATLQERDLPIYPEFHDPLSGKAWHFGEVRQGIP
jgi:hypothetical protein